MEWNLRCFPEKVPENIRLFTIARRKACMEWNLRYFPEKVPEHIRLFTIARRKACNISFRNHYQTVSCTVSGEHRKFHSISLELELIQSHMAQKPVLRGEVGCACVAREVSVERGGMGERGCASGVKWGAPSH